MEKEPIIVAVSGGFDPLHIGHIRYFREARALGDRLIVILNDDEWLMKKKGYVFMREQERKELLESIQYVDEVIIREPAKHMHIHHMFEKVPFHIFAKGGDRIPSNMPQEETIICEQKGIKLIYGIGGEDKPQSSSWLVRDLAQKLDLETFEKLRNTGKAI